MSKLPVKKTFLLKIAAIFIASLLFSFWMYRFNLPVDMKSAFNPHIVFAHDLPGKAEKIGINGTVEKGFSFFVWVKSSFHPGNDYHHTLCDANTAGEKIRLLLTGDGDLRMYWGSDELYRRENTIPFPKTSFQKDQWNELGFVYSHRTSRSVLTTYINGKPAWKKYFFSQGEPFLGFITLFPGERDDKLGGPFVGEAKSAIFLNRALSYREVKMCFSIDKDQKIKDLRVKITLFFLVAGVLFYLLVGFIGAVGYSLKYGDPGKVKKGIFQLGFLFFLDTVLFVIFNLGASASRYFNSLFQFSTEGIYLFVLNLLFFAVLLAFFLEKAAGASLGRCILISAAILMGLAFAWLASNFPRFEDISPFYFNVFFALLFTLLAGSFELLKLVEQEEKRR